MSVSANSGTVTGLTTGTEYRFYVVAKDAAGNRSENSNTLVVRTPGPGNPGEQETTCGTEDFENLPAANSSYLDREWSNKGIVWTATSARTDNQINIDGTTNRAICIRKGSLKSSVISGGIGSLTVKTYLPFADSNGNYTLKVNGVVIGQIPYSKTASTVTVNNINVAGNVVIELVDDLTSNRVSFDNLSWTCFTGLATDENASANQKISIYPNPVKNNEFYISGIAKDDSVKIYSLNGQLVQTIDKVENKGKVILHKLPKGVYLVKTKNQSSKIIVD